MYGIVGFIKLLLRDEPISGWRLCDGSLVAVADYPQLFAKTQYRFGGEGDHFALPTMHLPGAPFAAGALAMGIGLIAFARTAGALPAARQRSMRAFRASCGSHGPQRAHWHRS